MSFYRPVIFLHVVFKKSGLLFFCVFLSFYRQISCLLQNKLIKRYINTFKVIADNFALFIFRKSCLSVDLQGAPIFHI